MSSFKGLRLRLRRFGGLLERVGLFEKLWWRKLVLIKMLILIGGVTRH